MTTAVVLGGGFAGVLAAVVMARHVDSVTIVENGWYPLGPGERPGLAQGYQNHVLVAGGARALETLLPGTLDALAAQGAHRRDLSGGALIQGAEGWFRRHETGANLISCSRWLMDHVVRQRALADGVVAVRERTRVLGLLGDATRVTGAVIRHANERTETITADIVIDATGRRSQAPRWLAELDGQAAEGVCETTIDSGLAYSTRVYQAPPELAAAIPAVMLHPRSVAGQPDQGATLYPVEGGRWVVTLTGTRGGEPPGSEFGFAEFAQSLRSTIVAELMAAATPVGRVRPYRATSNRRRFFEHVRLPAGFLVIGDALVAVNPIYSHGLSVAALSALRLDRELERRGAEPAAFPGLQAAMAAEADRSWRMATGLDGRPTRLRREPTAFERQVAARMTQAAPRNPVLMTKMFRTHALIPPEAPGKTAGPGGAPGDTSAALSADEAIAQYPGLSEWWFSRQRPVAAASPALTGGVS
jgi:2-polyprenyl-6-methoxyphenol hydroxylase-like FAD-dependent oxidoreductase